MIITEFPYTHQISIDNDQNISIHAYNGSGTNVIQVGQGNIADKEKQAVIANVEVLEGIGKVVGLQGHLTKYLFLEITGDGTLELHFHTKRSAN